MAPDIVPHRIEIKHPDADFLEDEMEDEIDPHDVNARSGDVTMSVHCTSLLTYVHRLALSQGFDR